ncbi:hypothetical protein L917_15834 [Phytophthora nicotianae]|uniref:DUF4219 domain-containing protein n=2 Tax=Phytophthora nicotianae TaxID=4792 RepID=W2G5T6_PHYNI|nr:hypothetical protein L915_16134 [Phytophthora nicotianae]ETL84310.1 hypothetical protein L917_15834 [Phytophthora nicotianae]ETM37494.1 hypothetical protein L914_15958 [Phytophthora nicotianae]ETO66152.1 hypothetical protein F444_16597 [Phytophthora nicotianae P1976]
MMKWNSEKDFDGTNYTAWKTRVRAVMEANDLWDIATLRERPPRSGSRHDEDKFWHRERKAKAFLLETLTDDLVVSVGAKRYAYQVLEYLEQTYEAKTWGKSSGNA